MKQQQALDEQAEVRKQEIKNRLQTNTKKKEEFLYKKQADVQKESNLKMNTWKSQIANYETEAQQLERMEAELLGKL